MKIKKDEDLDIMFRSCFKFKRKFIEVLKQEGYQVKGESKLDIVQKKVLDNDMPHLKECEAKMLSELIDCASVALLDNDPPYNGAELRFLKSSTKFMGDYNTWLLERKI